MYVEDSSIYAMKRGKKKIFQISKYLNFLFSETEVCFQKENPIYEVNKIFVETELFWRSDAVQLKLLVKLWITLKLFIFSTVFF